MNKRSAAVHEAGHAIVAVELGWDVNRIEIIEGGPDDWGGKTQCNSSATYEDKAVYYTAGSCAEEVISGSSDFYAALADDSDLKTLANQILERDAENGKTVRLADSRTCDRLRKESSLKARAAIEKRRVAVEQLATALEHDLILEGPKLAELLKRIA